MASTDSVARVYAFPTHAFPTHAPPAPATRRLRLVEPPSSDGGLAYAKVAWLVLFLAVLVFGVVGWATRERAPSYQPAERVTVTSVVYLPEMRERPAPLPAGLPATCGSGCGGSVLVKP